MIRILCCPRRSSFRASSRFPGGMPSERRETAAFNWASFLRATGQTRSGHLRRAACVLRRSKMSSVPRSWNDLITSPYHPQAPRCQHAAEYNGYRYACQPVINWGTKGTGEAGAEPIMVNWSKREAQRAWREGQHATSGRQEAAGGGLLNAECGMTTQS